MARGSQKGSRGGRREGAGRRKGVPNRLTALARDAINYAADALGGADRLVQWVKKDPANEFAFWTRIYPRLLPVQVTGRDDGPIEIEGASDPRQLARAILSVLREAVGGTGDVSAGVSRIRASAKSQRIQDPVADIISPSPPADDPDDGGETFASGASIAQVTIEGSGLAKWAVFDKFGTLHGYRKHRADAETFARGLK